MARSSSALRRRPAGQRAKSAVPQTADGRIEVIPAMYRHSSKNDGRPSSTGLAEVPAARRELAQVRGRAPCVGVLPLCFLINVVRTSMKGLWHSCCSGVRAILTRTGISTCAKSATSSEICTFVVNHAVSEDLDHCTPSAISAGREGPARVRCGR